jgi:DNA-binding response OmpR family regulator
LDNDHPLPPSAADAARADTPPPGTRRALLIDVEPATAGLLAHWLAADHWRLEECPNPCGCGASAPHAGDAEDVGLVVIEIAFPRQTMRPCVEALTAARPGVPVLVLSPTFFADVAPCGDVARQLGATAALATPLSRERLLTTVRALAPAAAAGSPPRSR